MRTFVCVCVCACVRARALDFAASEQSTCIDHYIDAKTHACIDIARPHNNQWRHVIHSPDAGSRSQHVCETTGQVATATTDIDSSLLFLVVMQALANQLGGR